jgi:putative acetyltransferase
VVSEALIVRAEADGDGAAVFALHRAAFGGEDEGCLVEALRRGGQARLSLVAELGGAIVGHVLLSDLAIVTPAGEVAALALAPLAVVPPHQRQGIGAELVRQSLAAARDSGHRIVVVLGEPAYYGRFGFSVRLAAPLESPYPPAYLQALELAPGALAGVAGRLVYPPPFSSGDDAPAG